jgi:hypothetical protein
VFFDILVFGVDDVEDDDDDNNNDNARGKGSLWGSVRSETGVSDHEMMVGNGIDRYGSGLGFVMKVGTLAKALAAASESVSVGSTSNRLVGNTVMQT